MRLNWPSLAVRRSLAGRLLTGMLLAVGGVAIGFALLFQWIVLNHADLMVKDGLVGQAEEVLDHLHAGPDGRLRVTMHEPMQTGYDAFHRNLKYRVLDARGQVLVSSEASRAPLMQFVPAERTRFSHRDDGALSVATVPMAWHGRRIYVQTGRSDRFAELAIEAITPAVFQSAGLVATLAVVLLSIVLYWVTRGALRPVRAISDQAAQISPLNLAARLPTADLPDELSPLVHAFNAALDRVEEGYRSQQRFIANAAHELKTPLAVLRASIEIDGYPGHERYLSDIDLMARIVQQLLQLTEASERSSYAFAPVSVKDAAQDVLAFMRPLAAARDVALNLGGPACTVSGDHGALFSLLRNLVENAVRHAPAGSAVEVRIGPGGLQVLDQGAGVPAHEVPFLFERFWRSPSGKSDGAGLGLSIVAAVAAHHGWTVGYAPNHPTGAVFTVGFAEAQGPHP